MKRLVSLVLALLTAAAANAQYREDGESGAQATLPKSSSGVWPVLRTTRVSIDPAKGIFTAAFPNAVKALSGKPMKVSGFMLPLEPSARVKHFLLSKYTPVCSFCPPGDPNEVIEVRTRTAIPVSTRMMSVSGSFALQNNGEQGLFFQLSDATTG